MKHVDFVMYIKNIFYRQSKLKTYPTVRKCDIPRAIAIFCQDFISADADYNFEFHSEFNLNVGKIFRLLKPFWKGRCTES